MFLHSIDFKLAPLVFVALVLSSEARLMNNIIENGMATSIVCVRGVDEFSISWLICCWFKGIGKQIFCSRAAALHGKMASSGRCLESGSQDWRRRCRSVRDQRNAADLIIAIGRFKLTTMASLLWSAFVGEKLC